MKSTIIGARELEDALKKLPERLAKTVVQGGMRAGGTVIAKRAKQNLEANGSVDSRALLTKVGVRSSKGKARVGILTGEVTVTRKGRSKPEVVAPARYAHLVEFGSRAIPAEPFMRPAADEGAEEAVRKIGEVMARGVEREARAIASGVKSATTGRRT